MSGPSTGHMRSTLSSTTRWKKPPSSGISCTSRRRRSGLGQRGEPRRHREVGDLGVGRVEQQRVHAAVEAVEDADRAAGHLGDDVEPVARAASSSRREHLAPHLGVLVGLVEVHAHGAARPPGQVGHPRPLVDRHPGVVGRELEHAVAGARAARRRWRAARRAPRRCPARARRPSSGAAACGWWRSRARPARSASSTSSAMRSASSAVAGSLAAPRSPITNARSGPWAIWAPTSSTLGWRSTASRYSGKLVHSHVMPSVMAEPGDVLHALHQLDEPLVAVGGRRREADAAVAHHHGGDAVPRARRDPRVPGDLGVVVGVDVDPPGRDAAGRRRRAPGRPTRCWRAPASVTSTMRPPSTTTSAGRAGAPEPSTSWASRITRSVTAPVQQTDWRRAAGGTKGSAPVTLRELHADFAWVVVGDQRGGRGVGAGRPLARAAPVTRCLWRATVVAELTIVVQVVLGVAARRRRRLRGGAVPRLLRLRRPRDDRHRLQLPPPAPRAPLPALRAGRALPHGPGAPRHHASRPCP